MRQFDNEVEKMFKTNLNKQSAAITFESVWRKVRDKHHIRRFSLKKIKLVPVAIIITLIALLTVGFTYMRKVDKVDYPFVDDQRVIGKWESVDLVKNVEDFLPDTKSWKEELFLKSLVFINDGKMLGAFENSNLRYISPTWTKDLVLNKQEKTASRYIIKELNGNSYMFFEWKSGDYIFRNQTPSYYVLKKVDSDDYSGYQIQRTNEDNIDLPFVDDPQVIGMWEAVDYVKTIESYSAGQKSWLDDLYLQDLIFHEDGKVTATASEGSSSGFTLTWTKGLVLSQRDKTASEYKIKEINGDDYMFFQWKSGDYSYGGMKPSYYVLKRVK